MTNSPNDLSAIRSSFLNSLQAGEKFPAIELARKLLDRDPGLRQVSFISRLLENAAHTKLALKPLKVALLSSFSIEFLRAPLLVYSFLSGIDLQLYLPGFGQFQQEIRNPASGLYAFSPDVVILAVEGSDWLPEIYQEFLDKLTEGFDGELARFQEEFKSLVQVFRANSKATLLVNNFAPPTWKKLGILDNQSNAGQTQLVHRVNESLASVCKQNPGLFIVDYAGLVQHHGALRWYDDRMNLYARAPISLDMLPALSGEYAKFFRGLTGQTKKCLVLDLDNTLWGGVLGEEGPAGIQLGAVYPGNAYRAFQNAILDLHKRGILLAIASKNNLADVEEVFASHNQMVLKREHFASMKIHWGTKSESLLEISKELNIGLEHMVFVDDNPAECEEVGRRLPMVTTIALPSQPEKYIQELLQDGFFDGLTFSSEDRRRGELYRQRDEAESLRNSSGSIEEFYKNLEMQVTFAPVRKTTLARSSQLTQKTNQFNVTTLRYSEAELAERMQHPDWLLTTVTVRDRFGDNGIVGFSMARFLSDTLEIDTFLLSCRVIGRGIESAMLAYLCEQALRHGARSLRGGVVPTPKNVPARDLFERHGFVKTAEEEGGATRWTFDLQSGAVSMPTWMEVHTDVEVVAEL
jgi:FkbH-like protein